MLKSKEKMYLRGLANSMKPVFQIGKEGLKDNTIRDILLYLNKHELMKMKLLETAALDKEEVISRMEEAEIEVVQVIGRTYLLYKQSDNAENPIIFK